MTQSALAKERRELKEQQQRSEMEAVPKDLSRPWEDPMAQGDRQLAAEVKGTGLAARDVPEWKQKAFGKATSDAADTGSLAPPARALNAPTRLMKELGYGAGYHYDHDAKDGFAGDNYFPDNMERRVYYQPTDRGLEKQIAQQLAAWTKIRNPPENP